MSAAPPRSIRVAAPDAALIQALAEHRPPKAGWRVAPLAGPPEAESLVIIDLDDIEERRRRVESLRDEGFLGPILILGGCDGPRALEDEPIARPVRLGALLARIDAHWAELADPRVSMLGPYKFVPADGVLRDPSATEPIRLTGLECKLLGHLAHAKGGLVDREELLAHVWGYSAGVDTHTVETHIWRLRQKIETDDSRTRFLVTEAGGYRLLVGSAEDR